MKLLEDYAQFQDLFNKGYRFNPQDEVFYTTDPGKFKHPKEELFKDWKVIQIDRASYLNQRLKELKVKPDEIFVDLIDKDGRKASLPVFTANEYGDIDLLQYRLNREVHTYDKGKTSTGTRTEYSVRTRINPLYEPFCEGKYDGIESKNTPYWPPLLLDAFEKGEEVETLIITEGQFKAWVACQNGLPTVGLNSINHYKDSRTKEIHTEIVEFIHKCNVRNVVVLWDGDCRRISQKQLDRGTELTERPHGFFAFARNIRGLLQKIFSAKRLTIYFATIKTEDIEKEPKGIDDLFLVPKIKAKDILKDFERVGDIPGYYIDWTNITSENGVKNMRLFFHLDHQSSFYRFHREQIGKKSFVFYGTTYRIEKDLPVVEMPKDLKEYIRVGPDYFRQINRATYNQEGEKIREDQVLVPWSPTEITRDFGKDALESVLKLDEFTNVASHTNYNQIIDNKWNLYHDVRHETQEGSWSNIEAFIRHIFGEQFDMGMDYIQVLYSKPYQKLPVLALVSKDEGTGKSTFLKLLYMIFQNNMAYVSPDDIMGQWTSHWVSKLIVACEETFFEKKEATDKIKAMSTADKVMRAERFVNNTMIDCFLKFVFCSNFEDDFIKINKGSTRFWIIKVPVLTGKPDPLFEEVLRSEVPAFLHHLQNRQMVHSRQDRMFFTPEQIRTKAFYNVVEHSEPGIIKEIRTQMADLFLATGAAEVHMTTKDIQQEFRLRQDNNYINREIANYLKTERLTDDNGNQKVSTYSYHVVDPSDPNKFLKRSGKGRYFIFRRADFVLNEVVVEEINESNNPNQLDLVEAIEQAEKL